MQDFSDDCLCLNDPRHPLHSFGLALLRRSSGRGQRTMHKIDIGRVPFNAEVHAVECGCATALQQAGHSLLGKLLQAAGEGHVVRHVRMQAAVRGVRAQQQAAQGQLQRVWAGGGPVLPGSLPHPNLLQNVPPHVVSSVTGFHMCLQLQLVQDPCAARLGLLVGEKRDAAVCSTATTSKAGELLDRGGTKQGMLVDVNRVKAPEQQRPVAQVSEYKRES